MIKNYVVYHSNCPDGFTGLVLFLNTKKWELNNTVIYPDVPHTKYVPPMIKNRDVIIIDVAYNIKILTKIINLAKSVLFIDHHISIKNDVDKIKNDKIEIVYDEKESGASLVWKYFYKDEMPKFIKYVAQNDIGIWEDPNVSYLATYIETKINLSPTIKNFNSILKFLNLNWLKKCIKKGKYYYEYKQEIIKKNSKKIINKIFPSKYIINKFNIKDEKQYNVAVINGGCPDISALGNYICKNIECDFCIIWTFNFFKYIISMRSVKTDVSNIAHILGGGGHKGAATFSWNDDIKLLFD